MNKNLITPEEIAVIEDRIIAEYYSVGGTKLSPADPLAIFIKTLTYREALLRAEIKYISQQNYISTADGINLDRLGEFTGVSRLTAQASRTIIKFTRSTGSTNSIQIPSGTRVTADSKIFFATTESTILESNQASVNITAVSSVVGLSTVGYAIGSIKKIVDPLPYIEKAENTIIPTGGSETESDDNYRQRLLISPEKLSIAGPRGAYESIALNAIAGVADVYIYGEAGKVYITPLLDGGVIPTAPQLQQIVDACSADDKRPLTDYVIGKNPEAVSVNIDLTYYLYRNSFINVTDIEKVINDYLEFLKQKLGRDFLMTDIIYHLKSLGVKDVEYTSPAKINVPPSSFVIGAESININFGGYQDE